MAGAITRAELNILKDDFETGDILTQDAMSDLIDSIPASDEIVENSDLSLALTFDEDSNSISASIANSVVAPIATSPSIDLDLPFKRYSSVLGTGSSRFGGETVYINLFHLSSSLVEVEISGIFSSGTLDSTTTQQVCMLSSVMPDPFTGESVTNDTMVGYLSNIYGSSNLPQGSAYISMSSPMTNFFSNVNVSLAKTTAAPNGCLNISMGYLQSRDGETTYSNIQLGTVTITNSDQTTSTQTSNLRFSIRFLMSNATVDDVDAFIGEDGEILDGEI